MDTNPRIVIFSKRNKRFSCKTKSKPPKTDSLADADVRQRPVHHMYDQITIQARLRKTKKRRRRQIENMAKTRIRHAMPIRRDEWKTSNEAPNARSRLVARLSYITENEPGVYLLRWIEDA